MNLLDLLTGGMGGAAGVPLDPNQAPAPSPMAAPSPLQPQAAPQQASPQANPNAPITVMGPERDQWHPHKRTLLGTIADFALAAMGVPLFPFGHANHAQNIQDAMRGFQANPRQAINRLAQIKGEEFDASRLAGQEDDSDMRAANYKRQNDALDFQMQKDAETRAANIMYAAAQHRLPDGSLDPNTWLASKNVIASLDAARGTNIADQIPDTPDLSIADALSGTSMPVWRQAELLEQTRNHTLQHGDRQEGHEIQRERNSVLASQGAARIGVSETNAKTGQYNAQTSRAREEKTSGKPSLLRYDTKYGRGIVSPDGMEMHINPTDPRINQSVLHKNPNTGEYQLIYDNVGTASQPKWRLRH
jgi:hypothetical protein